MNEITNEEQLPKNNERDSRDELLPGEDKKPNEISEEETPSEEEGINEPETPEDPGVEEDIVYDSASNVKRFVNWTVDYVAYFCTATLVGLIMGLLGRVSPWFYKSLISFTETRVALFLFAFSLSVLFYVFFEYFFGLTPGKLVTNTRVVTITGARPSFARIAGRTLCRFIPFNALSFLAGEGWHDRFSGTLVIDNKEPVKKRLVPIIISVIIVLSGTTVLVYSKGGDYFFKDTVSSPQLTVNYEGVSFDYTDNWNVTTGELEKGTSYQISCVKKGAVGEEMTLIFVNTDLDLKLWVEKSIEAFKSETALKNAVFEEVVPFEFKGYDAYAACFRNELLREKYFGQIIVFKNRVKSVMFFKQCKSEEKLKTLFDIMENSLSISSNSKGPVAWGSEEL